MGTGEGQGSALGSMSGVIWLAAAERDVQRLYERAEEWNGGDAFLDRLEKCTRPLHSFPSLAPVFSGEIRRLLLARDSLGVFYAVEGMRIVILRVSDLRQDPKMIRRKLGID